MRTLEEHAAPLLLAAIAVLLLPGHVYAWQPNTNELTTSVDAGDFAGPARRAKNDYTIPISALELWSKLYDSDPDSREGLYLKLAIATAQCPPPATIYGSKVAIDPVERYKHYKTAHKNGELFPIFNNLTVWEYQKVVSDWSSDRGLVWARQILNTWRPDLRANQQVHKIVNGVWRRNSPFPFTDGFVSVMAGGGKCGPGSWFGRLTCRAFGIPTVGVGQPAHAAFAAKAADPSSDSPPPSRGVAVRWLELKSK